MLENLKGKLAPAIILTLGLSAAGCSKTDVPRTCESVRTEITEVDSKLHPKRPPMKVSPGTYMGTHMLEEERAKLEQWLADNNCE